MRHFEGSLRLPGEQGEGLAVEVDLTDEHHLRIVAGAGELGEWPLQEVIIVASEDGFHVRAEGDEVVLNTDNDAAFALAVGLGNAPPLLRRQMSALLRAEERPAHDPDSVMLEG